MDKDIITSHLALSSYSFVIFCQLTIIDIFPHAHSKLITRSRGMWIFFFLVLPNNCLFHAALVSRRKKAWCVQLSLWGTYPGQEWCVGIGTSGSRSQLLRYSCKVVKAVRHDVRYDTYAVLTTNRYIKRHNKRRNRQITEIKYNSSATSTLMRFDLGCRPSSWTSLCRVTSTPCTFSTGHSIRHQGNWNIFYKFPSCLSSSVVLWWEKAIFCSNPIRPTGTCILVGMSIILCYFTLTEATLPHLSSNYNKLVWNVGSLLTRGFGKVIRRYAYLLALSIISPKNAPSNPSCYRQL